MSKLQFNYELFVCTHLYYLPLPSVGNGNTRNEKLRPLQNLIQSMGWLIDLINFLGCGQNFPPPHPPLPTSGWTSSWQQERGGSNRENINKKKGTVKQAQCCEVIQLIGFPRIWFLKDGKKNYSYWYNCLCNSQKVLESIEIACSDATRFEI